jgi:hypothetical protein
MSSRTAALAILEAALKQMHVCALLHNDVNHLSHSPACFFAGRTSRSCLLPSSCCLLLACWWCRLLLAGAYQYWRTGACVLGPTCVDLGLAHRKRRRCRLLFMEGRSPAGFACSACCCCSVLAARCKATHRVRVQTRVRFQRRGPTSPIGFGPKSPSPRESPIGFGPKSPSPRKSPICFGPKSPSPRKSPICFGPESPSPGKSPIWQAIY